MGELDSSAIVRSKRSNRSKRPVQTSTGPNVRLLFAMDDGIVVVRSERQENVKRTALAPTHYLTTEKYLRTPETVLPQELIYGVIRAAEAPLPRHQAAVADFFRALDAHVRERQLGDVWLSPIDVILDEARALVLQPDLLFISNERRDILTDRIRGAPDMVIEVLSPNPRIGSLNERIGWFAEYGVRECWLLHQLERRLEIVQCARGAISERESFDDNTAIRSLVLPDFRLTIGSILRWAV